MEQRSDKIQIITRKYANSILASTGKIYQPLGKYLVADEVEGRLIWTAIDNSSGEAWTEEFFTKTAATRWLHGYASRNRFGEMLK